MGTGQKTENDEDENENEDENKNEDENENENGKTTRLTCRKQAQSFVRDLHRTFW